MEKGVINHRINAKRNHMILGVHQFKEGQSHVASHFVMSHLILVSFVKKACAFEIIVFAFAFRTPV